jgi:hypothetical protein
MMHILDLISAKTTKANFRPSVGKVNFLVAEEFAEQSQNGSRNEG